MQPRRSQAARSMSFRAIFALVFLEVAVATACDPIDPCIGIGTDLPENDRDIGEHASALRLRMTARESAIITGAAYAASQVEGGQSGVPVQICLRQGQGNVAEFRVLSISGKVLLGWQSVGELSRR